MYASQILLLSAIALASPVSVIAESKITKLAPDSVNVYLENGNGQASVVLLVQPKTGEPQVAVTDAMGSKDSIPMSSITWSWGGNPWNSAKQAVLRGELKVGPNVYVKEGEEYKGKILFIWAESTQPVSIDFIVKRQSTTELTVSPEALDVALGPYQPRTVTIHLKNTGNAAISKLEVSSVGLVDAATRNSTGPFSLSAEKIKIVQLKPSEEKDFNVDLPLPSLAGTYVGSMNLLANDDARKSVPLTLRTRGPTRLPLLSRVDSLSYLPRLPLVLFILVIALRQSQSSLEKKIDLLNKWEVAHHAAGSFVQARTKIGVQLIEIETLLSSPDDFSLSQLVEAAQRVGSSLPFYDALWLALIQASIKWNADEAKVLAVARQLDRVSLASKASRKRPIPVSFQRCVSSACSPSFG